jgi:hypothetical protein
VRLRFMLSDVIGLGNKPIATPGQHSGGPSTGMRHAFACRLEVSLLRDLSACGKSVNSEED